MTAETWVALRFFNLAVELLREYEPSLTRRQAAAVILRRADNARAGTRDALRAACPKP